MNRKEMLQKVQELRDVSKGARALERARCMEIVEREFNKSPLGGQMSNELKEGIIDKINETDTSRTNLGE